MSEQNKRILQFGIAFGLIGLIAAVYVWYIWGKAVEEKETVKQGKLQKELTLVNEQLEQIKNAHLIREEIAVKQAFLERASKRLPSTPDAEGFFENVSTMLTKSNSNVNLVMPVKIEERSSYAEIPWRIDAISQYVELGVFFNLVEQNPDRLMRVKKFEIQNDPVLPGYHNVQVTIGTFMFTK